MTSPQKNNSRPASLQAASPQGNEAIRPPSLLPSVFPDDDVFGGSAEGYEGERLAKLFLSDTKALSKPPVHQNPDEIEDDDVLEEDNVPEAEDDEQQPANFAPFFTLIEDVATGEQHHPHIHYIFSDDEPEMITNALVNTLDPDNSRGEELSPQEESRQGSKERYIILDIGKDGQSLSSAKSLVEDWQVTKTQITTAPTFDDNAGEDAGLMLKVEGMQTTHKARDISKTLERAKNAHNGDVFAAMNALATQYQEEQEALNKLTQSTREPSSSR